MKSPRGRHSLADAVASRDSKALRGRLLRVIRVPVACAIIGAGVAGYLWTDKAQLDHTFDFAIATLMTAAFAGTSVDPTQRIVVDGEVYWTTSKRLAHDPWLTETARAWARAIAPGAVCGGIVGIFWLGASAWQRGRRLEALLVDRFVGGTRLVAENALAALTAPKACIPKPFLLGSVKLPPELETRHMSLVGTTGSGKTTALRQLLDVVDARGETALVFDPAGEFIAYYFDPSRGDIILNPFDARGAYHNFFDEIRHPADAERIARYLITESGDEEGDTWLDHARNLVANVIRKLWLERRGTPEALLDALQSMPAAQLEVWLAGTSAARTFAEGAGRATASVLFMLTQAANTLLFLRAAPAEGQSGFSFAQFFAELDSKPGRKPWVFIPRKEEYFEALKPIMGLWLECAASAVLAMSPSKTRRVHFILDEVADLPVVTNLARILPEGRKFGASVVLTFQDVNRMKLAFRGTRAESILANTSTKLFLQLADADTRQWASDTIGNCEIEISTISDAIDPQTGKVTKTVATSRNIRPAVGESELRLPPYTGYLLLPDGMPVAKITLTDAHIRARGAPRHPIFVPIDVSLTLWGCSVAPNTRKATPTAKNDTAPPRPSRGPV